MLNRIHDVSQLKETFPLWTQDEAVAFECAREAIGHMIAICSSLMYDEKKKLLPDLKRIAELEMKRSFFSAERKKLHLDDKYNIARVRKEYGSKIKAYECDNGECPV
jgi:hypothetical protein